MVWASRAIWPGLKGAGRRLLPEQPFAFDESGWLCLFKLLAEIGIFRLKLFYASLRLRKLLLENRKLLAQKRDMLALNGCGAMLLDESFNGAEECAELHRPNETEISHGRVSWETR